MAHIMTIWECALRLALPMVGVCVLSLAFMFTALYFEGKPKTKKDP